MSIKKNTTLGTINITDNAIAALAGGAVMESYGVVGMTSKQVIKDGLNELLKKENYSKGVIVRKGEQGIAVDLYIVVAYGISITTVVSEIQKKVKYTLEKALNMAVSSVNVYIQGIKVVSE